MSNKRINFFQPPGVQSSRNDRTRYTANGRTSINNNTRPNQPTERPLDIYDLDSRIQSDRGRAASPRQPSPSTEQMKSSLVSQSLTLTKGYNARRSGVCVSRGPLPLMPPSAMLPASTSIPKYSTLRDTTKLTPISALVEAWLIGKDPDSIALEDNEVGVESMVMMSSSILFIY